MHCSHTDSQATRIIEKDTAYILYNMTTKADACHDLPTFHYDTLQPGQIRLLSPNESEDGLHWTLQTVNLASPDLKFDALSYTWGSQAQTLTMVCNNHEMQVHHNLHSALPHLARRMGRGVSLLPIWVDAVCINQADNEEKVRQIRLMNTLYGRAETVWVWLGCAEPEVQVHMPRAISLLPHVVEQGRSREELKIPRNFRSHEVVDALHGLEPAVWTAMLHLLRNAWYQRVWIVQEAALARDLVFLCGENRIDSKLLEDAVSAEEFHSYKVRDVNGEYVKFKTSEIDQNIMFYIRAIIQRKVSYTVDTPGLLLRLALLMDGHSCSVAQDRVLGMLGLVKTEEIDATGVTLRALDSVATLYTQFSTYIMLHNSPNDTQFWWRYFNLAFTLNKHAGLPSWVPDLHDQRKTTNPAHTTIDHFGREQQAVKFQASWRKGTIQRGKSPDELVIRGKLLDEVTLVYREVPVMTSTGRDTEAAEWMLSMLEWEEEVFQNFLQETKSEINPRTIEELEEQYWRTMMANNLTFQGGTTITADSWKVYHQVSKEVQEMIKREIQR